MSPLRGAGSRPVHSGGSGGCVSVLPLSQAAGTAIHVGESAAAAQEWSRPPDMAGGSCIRDALSCRPVGQLLGAPSLIQFAIVWMSPLGSGAKPNGICGTFVDLPSSAWIINEPAGSPGLIAAPKRPPFMTPA